MKVAVIGASGAVGTPLVHALEEAGLTVTPVGRRLPTSVDLSGDLDDLRRLAENHEVIVNTSGVENPRVTDAIGSAIFIDVSASADYLTALGRSTAAVVLGVGLAPGLSTILAARLHAQAGDDIDVAIMLGAGEKHGPAAVSWTADLIGTTLADPPEQTSVMNLHESRRIPNARGVTRRYLRADFPDHTLLRERGIAVRNYLTLSSGFASIALRLVGRLTALKSLVARFPALGDDRWEVTARNRRTGELITASGHSQSVATARVTALAVLASARAGVTAPTLITSLLSTDDLAEVPGIELALS